jgi:hypothetical protein
MLKGHTAGMMRNDRTRRKPGKKAFKHWQGIESMRYSAMLGLALVAMLLVSGCCNLATPKLPASFCDNLKSSFVKSACVKSAASQADDPRVREYYTDWDAVYVDSDSMQASLVALNTTDATAWNAAMTDAQRKAAYDSYFSDSSAYAARLDLLITHLDTVKQFLRLNKAYLDSQRVATQGDLDSIATAEALMKSNINYVKTNLDTMAGRLSLTQQEQQQKLLLFDTLNQELTRLG